MATLEEAAFHQESKLPLYNIIQISVNCFSDAPLQELENGWCFLENVVDPTNPTRDCYEDTQWSEVDGRFWSNQACFQEKNAPPPPCMSTLNNLCIFPFTYQNTTHNECTHVTSENGAAW